MAKFSFQKTFIRHLIATSALFEMRKSVLSFLGHSVWHTLSKWTRKAYFVPFCDEKNWKFENVIKTFSQKKLQ